LTDTLKTYTPAHDHDLYVGYPKPPREPALEWEDLLDFIPEAIQAQTLPPTTPAQAFAYLASSRRVVPDLVRDSASPVEAGLALALWAQANAGPRMLFGTPAGIAIDHAIRIAARITGQRQRIHCNLGDEASADWSLLLMTLLGGLSAREAAKHVDLGRDVVAKRLRTLLAEIEASLGFLSLNGQNAKFAPGVGRRFERTDHPRLRTGDLPAPLPASPDEAWLIAEAIEYLGGPTKLPPGCAADIVEKDRVRSLDRVLRGDPDDDYSPTIGKADALRTEGWYSRLPRAVDWRAIARELPPGPDRDAALKREDTIARLLADDRWPCPAYWPTKSKPTKRWAVAWHNCGVNYPLRGVERRSDETDDDFAGAVTSHNGKLTPRQHDSGPRVKRDLVDRFNAAFTREDSVPH
jgi:hypothetical protein